MSPAGGSIGGDTLLTLTGVNLHLLHQAEFRPKFEVRNFHHPAAGVATMELPCQKMLAGSHRLLVRETGGARQPIEALDTEEGLRLLCYEEPRYDSMYPFVGPSWPGMRVTLTSSLNGPDKCTKPHNLLHECAPPPFIVRRVPVRLPAAGAASARATGEIGRREREQLHAQREQRHAQHHECHV